MFHLKQAFSLGSVGMVSDRSRGRLRPASFGDSKCTYQSKPRLWPQACSSPAPERRWPIPESQLGWLTFTLALEASSASLIAFTQASGSTFSNADTDFASSRIVARMAGSPRAFSPGMFPILRHRLRFIVLSRPTVGAGTAIGITGIIGIIDDASL